MKHFKKKTKYSVGFIGCSKILRGRTHTALVSALFGQAFLQTLNIMIINQMLSFFNSNKA